MLQREALSHAVNHADPEKRLVVMPLLDESQIGESSIDVRLGPTFRLPNRTDQAGLDPATTDRTALRRSQEKVSVEIGSCLWLHPNQFVLGATLEYLRFPDDLGGYVVGRSTWGRVGLLIATAIMIHPGFTGTLTLELVNQGNTPIALYPGAKIGQLAIHRLEDATEPYSGGYTLRTEPEIPDLGKEHQAVEHLRAVAGRLDPALAARQASGRMA
jgi:dCTP deaminase